MPVLDILIFAGSLGLLVYAARNWFVKSAENIGLWLGMSPFLIGVTIVGIGTSLPELTSSLIAVWHGETELVGANVVGSNVGNILLILGLSAIAGRGLTINRSASTPEIIMLIVSTLLLVAAVDDKKVSASEGFILVAIFICYIAYIVSTYEHKDNHVPKHGSHQVRLHKELLCLAFGIAGVYFGAYYTIESLVRLSDALSVPKAFVAITALAIGTSLPELVVSLSAALQKKKEISVGNIIGSNVFNALFILGLPAMKQELAVDPLTLSIGLPFLFISTFAVVLAWVKGKISVLEGFIYLGLFAAFIIILFRNL